MLNVIIKRGWRWHTCAEICHRRQQPHLLDTVVCWQRIQQILSLMQYWPNEHNNHWQIKFLIICDSGWHYCSAFFVCNEAMSSEDKTDTQTYGLTKMVITKLLKLRNHFSIDSTFSRNVFNSSPFVI
jgi:hypothetical protein